MWRAAAGSLQPAARAACAPAVCLEREIRGPVLDPLSPWSGTQHVVGADGLEHLLRVGPDLSTCSPQCTSAGSVYVVPVSLLTLTQRSSEWVSFSGVKEEEPRARLGCLGRRRSRSQEGAGEDSNPGHPTPRAQFRSPSHLSPPCPPPGTSGSPVCLSTFHVPRPGLCPGPCLVSRGFLRLPSPCLM